MRPDSRRCDCLNWCGDDPWLVDGRVDPCEHRQALLAAAALERADRAAIRAAFDTDCPRDVIPLDAVRRLIGL